MTPFQKLPQTPLFGMMHREVLLAQPAEHYKDYFGGRVPTIQEKQHVVELVVQSLTSFDIYQNDIYIVEANHRPPHIHLAIQRNDGQACVSWRDFQQIKNEIVGVDNEAFELFPSESRLVDTANQYHLWVYADPRYRIPAGFDRRRVTPKPITVANPEGKSLRNPGCVAALARLAAFSGAGAP